MALMKLESEVHAEVKAAVDIVHTVRHTAGDDSKVSA